MQYWEENYARGKTSDRNVTWEWKTVDELAGPLDEVTDVGCGDLTFWNGRSLPQRYVGIDFSRTIVQKNAERWPQARFFFADSATRIEIPKARVVFCLNVLFHLMDDSVYLRTLANLAEYSSSWLFVSTWRRNPYSGLFNRARSAGARAFEGHLRGALTALRGQSDGSFQRYRDFTGGITLLNKKGFDLKTTIDAPNPYGALYAFQRSQTSLH